MVTFASAAYYFLIRKNVNLKSKNDVLQKNLEAVSEEARTMGEVQHKQAEIAARPAPERDDVHNWMLGFNKRDQH